MAAREPEEIYLSIPRFVLEFRRKNPSITIGSMEYKFRHRQKNGYLKAFLKDGKRKYVCVNEYWKIFKGEK